jgi:hypothetical protein
MPSATYTLTNAEASRMAAAVGRDQKLGRDATNAEVKNFWADRMRSFVQESERRVSRESYEQSFTADPFDPT